MHHEVIMKYNPYIFGNPVPPEKFLGRADEIKILTSRITPNLQSVAIIGEPKSGKSSILKYVFSEKNKRKLFNSFSNNITFSLVDAHSFGETMTQSQFWERCLFPLEVKLNNTVRSSPLHEAFNVCKHNNYGSFVLERLFTMLSSQKQFLILGIDEFDALINHPILNKAEFFGGLRALASNLGSLALIIASRQNLASLNNLTQEYSRQGSPYFNTLHEIHLGKFDKSTSEKILAMGRKKFTEEDKRFLIRISGENPYLIQAASFLMWNEHEANNKSHEQRRETVTDKLFDIASLNFKDTWKYWSPETKKVFTTIALDEAPTLLEQHTFDINQLIKELPSYLSEIKILYKQGFIIPDKELESEWRVCPEIYIWCLADELVSVVRDAKKFEIWFRSQEWEGYFKRGEKEQLTKAGQQIALFMKDGISAFFKSYAERLTKN